MTPVPLLLHDDNFGELLLTYCFSLFEPIGIFFSEVNLKKVSLLGLDSNCYFETAPWEILVVECASLRLKSVTLLACHAFDLHTALIHGPHLSVLRKGSGVELS